MSSQFSQSESVRDVQFSRFRDNIFSSAQENGNVQIWDLRKPDHYTTQFTAHSGPVFSCDWHLEDQNYLATAGRDKTIKIWDISTAKKQPLKHSIQAIASVARIKWRPHQKTQIVSSSLVVDFKIYIWDFNREYVPFVNIQEHKDVATDFIWRDSSANILISVGKDGTVYQHLINEIDNHWLKANPCALSLNNNNDIFFAASNYLIKDVSPSNIVSYLNAGNKESNANGIKDYLNSSNAKNLNLSLSNQHLLDREYSQNSLLLTNSLQQQQTTSSLTTTSPAVQLVRRGMQIFQHNQSISQQSINHSHPHQTPNNNNLNNQLQNLNMQTNFLFHSSAVYFKNKNSCKEISMDWFVQTALNYQLTGKPLSDLFDHNAIVAEQLDRIQIAQTWRILKQLYIGTNLPNQQQQSSTLKAQLNQSNTSINNSSLFINENSSSSNNNKQSTDKKNDLKTRNNSGQQNSRHASGSNVQQQQSSSVIENSTLTNKFNTTRNRLATYSGSSRLPTLTSNTPVPLNLTQSNKNLANLTITTTTAHTTNRNDSDADESDDQQQLLDQAQVTPLEKEFSREHQDFFFGDGDVNDTNLTSYDVATNDILTELDDTAINPLEVQREAFQLKHEIQDFTIPTDLDLINHDLNTLNLVDEIETFEDDLANASSQTNSKNKIIKDNNVERLLAVEVEANPAFKFSDIVIKMLMCYADQGDVQTTVSILIILGEKLKYAIDLAMQEHWFYSYIELLSRFQLWNVINQVSNLSVLPSINSLNQVSTTIYTSCASCNKPIKNKVGWWCERCKKVTSKCSVCHEIVKGIYVWCKICSHGAHLDHAAQWFSKNKSCPSGCGHQCEFN